MLDRLATIAAYRNGLKEAIGAGLEYEFERELCKNDLFYLLTVVLGRADMNHDWLFARCREIEKETDGYLDLWAREHFKSSAITFGLTIRDILRDPEITVGIFSFNRPTAKAFLRQIKREFEANDRLKELFPDVLWANPQKEAPKWSEDDGIIVRRKGNPKESTIEAWGLVDGQPTSKHFKLMVYDDVVTADSVTTPEMIEKVTRAWEVSLNLTTEGGVIRYIGTRWHFADTYRTIIERGAAKERRYPVTVDGTVDGEPVLWTRERVAQKRRDMGPYSFGCLPGDAPIFMADGTEKRIDEIRPGDVVVGYTIGTPEKRGRFVASKVVAAGYTGVKEIVRHTLADGSVVKCTKDHKWFTGRIEDRRMYAKAGDGTPGGGIKYLHKMYTRKACPDEWAAAWLGGIFDGEGAISGHTLHISQSPEHNPDVCAAIEAAMAKLGLPFGMYNRAAGEHGGRNHKAGRAYYLNDGKQAIIDFVRWCRPVKSSRIMARIVLIGRKTKEVDIVSSEPLPSRDVYGIETETGNYIAFGMLSKNSQMLLDPTADRKQGFRDDWIVYYQGGGEWGGTNKYLLVDPASSKKKESDYTSMVVIALGQDENYYLIDAIRDRLSLKERGDALFALHRRWRPQAVGYERYGMMADVEYLKERMASENYRFEIVEVGGQVSKPDRIRRLIPVFEARRFMLPETLIKVDYEGRHVDLVQSFLNEEYRPFPVGLHDDMFDAISRIWDVPTIWPKSNVVEDRYARKRERRKPLSYMAA